MHVTPFPAVRFAAGKITIDERSYEETAKQFPNASIPKQLENLKALVAKAKPQEEKLPGGVTIEFHTNNYWTRLFYPGESEWATVSYTSSNGATHKSVYITRGWTLMAILTGKTWGESQKSLVKRAIKAAKRIC